MATLTGTFTIACECSNAQCLEMIEISPGAYLAVRKEPRHFVVLEGHVIPEIETVVRESADGIVVEKNEAFAEHLTAGDEATAG